MSNVKDPDQVGYECRFAVYVEPPEQNEKDLHLVKIQKHLKDGSVVPEVKLVYGYQRPYWVASKGSRNYKQHKEWELKSNLIQYQSPQSELLRSVARTIGFSTFKGTMKKLCENPYIYGTEIGSTVVLKKALNDAYPNLQTRYTVAVGDIETDVVHGTKEIVMMSITFKNSVTIAVLKSYLQGETMVAERFDKAMKKYLGAVELIRPNKDTGKDETVLVDILKERNIDYKLHIVDTPVDIVKLIADKANELKPDFFAFWNIDYDVPKMIEALEKQYIDPKDVFSDPIVPKQYRYFRYKQGPKQKVTASGLVTPIKPAAQWHTVFSTSSFYFVDAMCVYKQVRTGKQEEQSYALDKILKKNKLGGKLHFAEADHLSGLKWHQFMQSNHKLEYMVYNIWDCISIEMLDEKNSDLGLSMPMFSGYSDFQHFNSQPRRLVDKLHYFCLDRDRVIGTTPPKEKKKDSEEAENDNIEIDFSADDEDDEDDGVTLSDDKANRTTLSLRGWIITLPAHLVHDNGLKCIEEFPDLTTNIHAHVGD